MTIWCPSLPEGEGPIYKALADAIAQAVEVGELRPGGRLPPQRDLADALGVALTTVSRAYATAERRGLVRGEVGRGTFVRSRTSHATGSEEDDSGLVDLRFNTLLPWAQGPELLDSMARQITAGDPAALFGYGVQRGSSAHRDAGAYWMTRAGLPTDGEQVLLTVGIQHALTVVLTTLTEPGDVVLVEEVTYAGMRTLANVLGVRLVPVELDREGLVPDRLRALLAAHRPKLLYCMPTLQNPTSAVMGEVRRREIAAIVNEARVPVLEDDSYGFVMPDVQPLSVDIDRAYYLVGTSKTLLPGLRVGYLRAPPQMVGRLEAVLAATVYATSPIMADVAAQWIRDGTADRVMAWKREQFRRRQRLAFDLLADADYRSHPRSPHGWLRLPEPWTARAFVEQARLHQVLVAPADEFAVARDAPHSIRLCVGPAPSQAALERALRVLAGMVTEAPEAGRVMV